MCRHVEIFSLSKCCNYEQCCNKEPHACVCVYCEGVVMYCQGKFLKEVKDKSKDKVLLQFRCY